MWFVKAACPIQHIFPAKSCMSREYVSCVAASLTKNNVVETISAGKNVRLFGKYKLVSAWYNSP